MAWILRSNLQPSVEYGRPPLTNADGSVKFDHTNLVMPSSVDVLIAIIKSAHKNHRKVKVLGAGHSRSAIAHSSDIYISLYNYTGVMHVDRENREVVVRAGTMLRDLNSVLRDNGLALSSLPTLVDQTVGGALAVGSHGTGLKYGNMATFVTSLSFVSGTGKLISVNASTNPELFKAALVSLGMIGVLTDVTFRCEEWFNLRENVSIRTLDYCLQNFDRLSSRSDHGKMWIEAHSGVCAVFDVWRTRDPVTEKERVSMWDIKIRVSEPLLWVGSWLPSINPLLLSFLYNNLQIFTPYERVAVSHDGFVPTLYVPDNHQVELMVDMKDCSAALTVWREIAINTNHANLFIEVRYVKADDIWLSHDYGRDSCHITILIYNPSREDKESYFRSLYDAFSQFSPRLHWGKYPCSTGSQEVESMYPRLSDFARIRQETDPHGIFINHALRTMFGFDLNR